MNEVTRSESISTSTLVPLLAGTIIASYSFIGIFRRFSECIILVFLMISRRNIVKISAIACISPSLLVGCSESNSIRGKNVILGGGRYRLQPDGPLKHVFSTVDLDAGNTSLVEMTFLPHGIHQHPSTPDRIAIFSKKGPDACELDLANQKVTRLIKTDSSRHFYGHGAYSKDGQLLYCTEAYLNSYKGIIAIRDANTLDYLGEFPSFGKEPHECKLIAGGDVMVVTNGGGPLDGEPPCVTYIDVKSQKLLERVLLTNDKLNTGHLAVADDGGLVVVSAPRSGLSNTNPGGVSIKPPNQAIKTISSPADVVGKMTGEALSVVIANDANVTAVTHPDGGMVTFWSTTTLQLLKVIELPYPRGVTLSSDQKVFVISYDTNPKLASVNVKSLTQNKSSVISDTYITGSHIVNWSRGIPELSAPGPVS